VAKYTDFTEMNVWKMAMAIAASVFKLTDSLPRKEDYGLTSQIRRSATSISANIAEAFGRTTSADKRKFYDYARGSAFETKSHLLYGREVGYFCENESVKLTKDLELVIHEINKVKKSLS
jgi:four helix bundle protein